MSWNYRVMRHEQAYGDRGEVNVSYAIHEVWYKDPEDDDSLFGPAGFGYSENPIAAWGDSVEDLRSMLQLMLWALDQPVLEYK